MCEKPSIKSFSLWKIVENSFPYDLIAIAHHMLIPARHVIEEDLTKDEIDELKTIKLGYVNNNYDYVIETTHKNRSVPSHFHLHVIIGKP